MTITLVVMLFFVWLWFIGPLVVYLNDKRKRGK